MSTEYLDLPELSPNDTQVDIRENGAKDGLDAALAGQLIIDLSDNINFELDGITVEGVTPTEFQFGLLIATNTGIPNTGIVDIIIPNLTRKQYTVVNNTGTGFDVRLIHFDGEANGYESVLTPDGSISKTYCDGIDVWRIT